MNPRDPDDPHDFGDPLEALLAQAEEALDEGDVDRALELLEEPAQADDADPEVRAMFGLALFYGGDYEDAYEWLLEAVASDPEDVESRGALGVCHFYRLESVTAEKELRRALLTEPEWAEAHYWLGRVLEWRGRYPEAMVSFQRAWGHDKEQYPVPERLTEDELDAVVHDAIEQLPPRIKSALDDVAILVEEYPSEDLLKESEPPLPPDLLGLFSGATHAERQSTTSSGVEPGTIHVFRRNIEHFGGDRDEVVDELRVTLLHEIGHALGMDEDELHRLGLE